MRSEIFAPGELHEHFVCCPLCWAILYSRRRRSRWDIEEWLPNQVRQISVDGQRGQVYIPLISMKRK